MRLSKEKLVLGCITLLGLCIFGSQISHAKTVPQISKTTLTFNKNDNEAKLKGKAKGIKKLKVLYNRNVIKTVNISKKGHFSSNLKFSGYKDVILCGLNKSGKEIVTRRKLSSKNYASPKPMINEIERKNGTIYFDVNANENSTLIFYYNGKKIYTTRMNKTNSHDMTVAFSDFNPTNNSKYIFVKQKQVGKKISPAIKTLIPDEGQSIVSTYN